MVALAKSQTKIFCFAFFSLAMFSPHAQADLVELKSGGKLRGTVEQGTAGSTNLELKTLTGGRIVIDSAHVREVIERPRIHEEYEIRARLTPMTIEAQWLLAEWCRKHRLKEQRADALRAILEIDPEHMQAHYALGHTKRDGEWTSREEVMEAQGYVKYRGEYVTPEELKLIKADEDRVEQEREWFGKVRLWYNWAKGRHEGRRQQGIANLKRIKDPFAIEALVKTLADEPNRNVRLLFVTILKNMAKLETVGPLVRMSVFDGDRTVRYASIDAIAEEFHPQAIPLYIGYLRNEVNKVVRRSGVALGRIGTPEVVPYLIEALVTNHKYKVQVEQQGFGVTMGAGGQVTGGASSSLLPPEVEARLLAGGYPNGVIVNDVQGPKATRTVSVRVDQQNPEVLTALQKLTEADFGYNQRSWKLWWLSQKKVN